MEVHKHPHHVTHKKKWGEYLLEFFMLFLAVFLGFIAENIREDSVERHAEKKYMRSLLVDLQKDRENLRESISKGAYPIRYNDSLSAELQKKPLQGNEKRIYHFVLLYTTLIDFTYHDRTITQLKNSGGFRMIDKQNVSDALMDYDTYMRESINYAAGWWTNNLVSTDIHLTYQVYEFYRVQKLQDSAFKYEHEIDKVNYPSDLKLLRYDDNIIKQLLNSMSYVRGNDEEKYKRAIKAFEMNINLIALIKKEYHLD